MYMKKYLKIQTVSHFQDKKRHSIITSSKRILSQSDNCAIVQSVNLMRTVRGGGILFHKSNLSLKGDIMSLTILYESVVKWP